MTTIIIENKTAFFLHDYGWQSAATSQPDVNKTNFVGISLQNLLKRSIFSPNAYESATKRQYNHCI